MSGESSGAGETRGGASARANAGRENATGKLRAFALLIVAAPLVLLAGALWLARTEWFEQRVVPQSLRGLDAENDIRGRSCEVLVFGDSTALTGVDPAVIERVTGMTACNVAQTESTLSVLGTRGLEKYLQLNVQPKYLVMLWSPGNFYHRPEWGDVPYFEGMTQMVRHWPAGEWMGALVRHPNFAFDYAARVYAAAVRELLGMGFKPVAASADPAQNNGHMILPLTAEQSCQQLDPKQIFPGRVLADRAYVSRMRAEFAKPGTTLFVDVSPIPECDPNLEWHREQTRGLSDNTLRTLPITDYNNVDRHFTAQGAEIVSEQVAQQVLAAEAKSGSAPSK